MGEEEKKDARQYKANGPPHLESTQSTNSGASARVKVVWKIAPPIQVAMTNMKTILACQLISRHDLDNDRQRTIVVNTDF